jgi:glutaredoxin 3
LVQGFEMQYERILYVKNGCPWCIEVEQYLDQHQIEVERVVVSGNAKAMAEMVALSGQSKAPTLDWEGEVLADFGVDELIPFLEGKV